MLTLDQFYEIAERDLDIVACLECTEYLHSIVLESLPLSSNNVRAIPKEAFNKAP